MTTPGAENDDASTIVEEFFAEPWTVIRRFDSLSVSDETPAWKRYFGAGFLSLTGIALAAALWWYCGRQGNLGRFGWIGVAGGVFSGLMLQFHAAALVIRGLRGPTRFVFDAPTRSLRFNGERLAGWDELRVRLVTRTYGTPGRRMRSEYEVCLPSGEVTWTFGRFAHGPPAERLARTMAEFALVPLEMADETPG